MNPFMRVRSVKPLEPWSVRVRFTNGEQRDINLAPSIAHGSIFESVRTDAAFFGTAQVDGGTITWPNGADIDPDVLAYGGPPLWAASSSVATHEQR